jgi:D-glycero-alpha-D-manno-heptose 1-phosphate guanylyltransferase
MDAIILAGGLGTRLREVVSDMPKCMAPVCSKPFLAYIFAYLSDFPEVKNVILSVGYLKRMVMDWANKQPTPFAVLYSQETTLLGTGGAIKRALSMVNSEDVLILNGDTFFDIDLSLFCKRHKASHSQLSLALKPMQRFDRYGNVSIDFQNRIIAFYEKKFCEQGLINGGVYLLSVKNTLLNDLPEKFSFETEVLQQKLHTQSIYGFEEERYFIDIGIPDDYKKANEEFVTIFERYGDRF